MTRNNCRMDVVKRCQRFAEIIAEAKAAPTAQPEVPAGPYNRAGDLSGA